MMKVLASKLFGKPVILDVGMKIGKLYDFKFDQRTGEIYALLIEPDETIKEIKDMFRWEGEKVIIPITTLKSVGDFIVIDKRKLAMYKL